MTRKDSEKDSERTHYYSQFWLDVAAGRRIIGAPKPEDEGADVDVLEATLPLRKNGRTASYDDSDDIQFDEPEERIVHPVAEPLATVEEFIEPETEEIDLESNKTEAPDFKEEVLDDIDIPDMDLGPADEEKDDEDAEEDEESADDEDAEGEVDADGASTDEEEEDEDLGWGGRGRKRNKTVRPKAAPPKKAPRREPRRGY